MNSEAQPQAGSGHGQWFATTAWTVVLRARDRNSSGASEALERLCQTYWPPIYSFICRQGYDAAEAKDLTQDFFLRLVEREYLQLLRHQRGRFRSFLLTLVKHFLQEHRGRMRAQKRGGGMRLISLEEYRDGSIYLEEPVDHLSPDQAFERRWAQTVFQTALDRLREEYEQTGRGTLFDLLKDYQPRDAGGPSYAQIGAQLGMTEPAVKSAVQRMRQRHREILRQEIAHTVTSPAEIEDEICHLRDVLSAGSG